MRTAPPYLACSRPALELLERLPPADPHLAFARVERLAGKPRGSVLRLLNELVESFLIAKVRRDWYATPTLRARAVLVVEPSGYHRSLLLHDDVFPTVSIATWAFACVAVRSALPFELPRAIPVLKLDQELLVESDNEPDLRRPGIYFQDALRYNFDDAERMSVEVPFPSNASADSETLLTVSFPALPAATSLALLAATADPRIVAAVRTAALRLKVPVARVLAEARRLEPRTLPVRGIRSHTVVFPRWLQNIADLAAEAHGHDFLRGGSQGGQPP